MNVSGYLLSTTVEPWTLKEAMSSVIKGSGAPEAARARERTKAAKLGVGSIVSCRELGSQGYLTMMRVLCSS